MPFWAWLLIDLGILILGAGWWAILGFDLANRGERLAHVVKPMLDAAAALEAAQLADYEYTKPESDLESDPVRLERAWEHRMALREQKKQARQRRLIARLRK